MRAKPICGPLGTAGLRDQLVPDHPLTRSLAFINAAVRLASSMLAGASTRRAMEMARPIRSATCPASSRSAAGPIPSRKRWKRWGSSPTSRSTPSAKTAGASGFPKSWAGRSSSRRTLRPSSQSSAGWRPDAHRRSDCLRSRGVSGAPSREAYTYERLLDEPHYLQEERIGEHARCSRPTTPRRRASWSTRALTAKLSKLQRRIGERTRQRDERIASQTARREEAVAADLRAREYLSAVAEILRKQRTALVRNEPSTELRNMSGWLEFMVTGRRFWATRALNRSLQGPDLKVAAAPPSSDELKRALLHELDLVASPPALNLWRSRNDRGGVEAPFDLHALLNPTALAGGATVGDHGPALFIGTNCSAACSR